MSKHYNLPLHQNKFAYCYLYLTESGELAHRQVIFLGDEPITCALNLHLTPVVPFHSGWKYCIGRMENLCPDKTACLSAEKSTQDVPAPTTTSEGVDVSFPIYQPIPQLPPSASRIHLRLSPDRPATPVPVSFTD